jgi:hypothetical protein
MYLKKSNKFVGSLLDGKILKDDVYYPTRDPMVNVLQYFGIEFE